MRTGDFLVRGFDWKTYVRENVDIPIGQFLLIGNFHRRLARELLIYNKLR